MTEAEYNSKPGIRRSALWKLNKSPKHFRYELEHPSEPTQAMIFGTAVHCAVLTPEAFSGQYTVIDLDLRTKEGRAAKQAALEEGKILLTKDQMEAVKGICVSLQNDPFARKLLAGKHETPYLWTDDITGEECKCRTDCEVDVGGQHIIVDLKTCADASTEMFMRDAVKLGYHVQTAMYCDGVKTVTGQESAFVFVCVEKEPPYAVNILQADEAFMLYGMDEYRYLLGLYHECMARNEWPGYAGLSGDVNTLELPAWLKKGVE